MFTIRQLVITLIFIVWIAADLFLTASDTLLTIINIYNIVLVFDLHIYYRCLIFQK